MQVLTLFTTLTLALFTVGRESDTSQNPVDVDSIRNTLALYSLSVDTKNFAGFESVFTTDAVADYSQLIGVLHGLSEIEQTLKKALTPVNTQHSLTTHYISLLGNGKANTTTYVIATHFGVGVYSGQLLTAWAKYDDALRTSDNGSWLIYNRLVTFMGPIVGNLSIVNPQ